MACIRSPGASGRRVHPVAGVRVCASDGAVLTSHSTLRFRSRDELAHSLTQANLVVEEVRDAPDRPGREFVFIAKRRHDDANPT